MIAFWRIRAKHGLIGLAAGMSDQVLADMVADHAAAMMGPPPEKAEELRRVLRAPEKVAGYLADAASGSFTAEHLAFLEVDRTMRARAGLPVVRPGGGAASPYGRFGP